MVKRRPGLAPLTLVLTLHNSESELPDLLASIGRLRVIPSEMSITDLGSTDGTLEVLRAWSPPCGIPVRVITAPGASTSEGRNLAIESASFDHIAVVDGAVCLHPGWLAQLWTALCEEDGVVAGRIQPVGSTLMERAIGRVQTPEPSEMESSALLPSSRSIAFSKSRWDAVGGYPEWLRHGQDEAFGRALREAGAVVRFVPAARSSWNPRQSLAGYVADCFRVSRAQGAAGFISSSLAARLLAYLCGLAALLVFRRSTLAKFAAAAAWGVHVGPYLRRVWRTRAGSPDGLAGRLWATLAVVIGADAGSFVGYPLGLLKARWTHGQDGYSVGTGAPGPATTPIDQPSPGRHRRVIA